MAKPLTKLGKALDDNMRAAGLNKTAVAKLMNTTSRATWDRATTAAKPTVELIKRAAAAVKLNEDEALRLAGYNPRLVAETRQQPEQQQQAELLAG